MCYKILEHTADLKIEFNGSSKKDLFQNSAKAISKLSFGSKKSEENSKNAQKISLEINEDNIKDIYVDFIREILYNINENYYYFFHIEFNRFSTKKVTAKCYVSKKQENDLQFEIKAVTYHDLEIEEKKDKWYAQVTFDI